MNVTIWHNPRCSKSRQTLALITERSVSPIVRNYLQDAPNEDEIRDVLEKLKIPAINLMRTGEKLFRELGLTKDADEGNLIRVMAECEDDALLTQVVDGIVAEVEAVTG